MSVSHADIKSIISLSPLKSVVHIVVGSSFQFVYTVSTNPWLSKYTGESSRGRLSEVCISNYDTHTHTQITEWSHEAGKGVVTTTVFSYIILLQFFYLLSFLINWYEIMRSKTNPWINGKHLSSELFKWTNWKSILLNRQSNNRFFFVFYQNKLKVYPTAC